MTSKRPAARPNAGSLAPRWRRALVAALDQGLKDMADPALEPARRVQQGRRAAKAGRALLRLAPSGLSRQARAARMALKSARRALSEARDADALVEALEDASGGTGAKAFEALSRPLADDRGDASGALAAASGIFRRLRKRVEGWPLRRDGGEDIRQGAARGYRRARRRVPEDFDDPPLDALHAWRTVVADLRHQTAFFAAVAAGKPARALAKRAARLKELQDAIGAHRDLALLGAHVEAKHPEDSHERLMRRIARKQRKRLDEARDLADDLFSEKPKAYAAMVAALRISPAPRARRRRAE
jgi:CHAD domain-containing protein